jgi:serine/threonine-protein phosphatase PGAM5
MIMARRATVRGEAVGVAMIRLGRGVSGFLVSSLLCSVVASLVFTLCAFGDEDAGEDTGVRTVYLIRHGQYDHEDDRDPDVGRGLVPLGIAQARLIAARLRSLPVKMTSLHSSTMTRARETAMVIAEDFPELEHQQSRLIRECTPPTWREDIMAEMEPGEGEACREKLEEAFPIYFIPSPDEDLHDIIVCHGNVIRYFVTKVLRVDPMAWLGMSIGNCSLTIVRINADGSMKLLAYGDVGHLPPNLQTGLYGGKRELVVPRK